MLHSNIPEPAVEPLVPRRADDAHAWRLLKRDPDSNAPQSDDIGRPKFKARKHDHQYGWFDSIAKRHGLDSFEVRQARMFADKHGQTYFGWASPPEGNGESLTNNSGRAVDGFQEDDAKWSEKSRGVTSIGMQAGNGETVTIGAESLDDGIQRIDDAIGKRGKKAKKSKKK